MYFHKFSFLYVSYLIEENPSQKYLFFYGTLIIIIYFVAKILHAFNMVTFEVVINFIIMNFG